MTTAAIFDFGKHSMRLMPDHNNLASSIVRLDLCCEQSPDAVHTKYFAYCIENGVIRPYQLNLQLYHILEGMAKHTVYVNSNGQVLYTSKHIEDLARSMPIGYSMNDDGNFEIYRNMDEITRLPKNIQVYKDVKHLDHILPMDLSRGYVIHFEIIPSYLFDKNHPLRQIVNIYIDLNVPPIYNVGDSKEAILKMYDGLPLLQECVDSYKIELESHNDKFTYKYGDEAKAIFWESRQHKQ